ncbi:MULTISPECIES: hypothetical protein [Enterobacteriaceae]|uniref:hypothetical protein n=1 Tax=Enterobacteriaceae TaxID=543 RepID=UPI0010570C6A|nr:MULTISPECIES: hypothetical protein [Enterobacteriaceae]MCE6964958.1 hypothetical protein [Enterobacter sp. MW07]EFJ2067217.1 hypothetical protein [Escherichia coli]EFK5480768.1 hypothetical protein [Escherichia coli]MBF2832454.1 hypothetical protein [Escherichia coli]MBF2878032.1 hypothetical protein [Escherichia coli]
MSLEERVGALESAIASLALQQSNNWDLSDVARSFASESIIDACCARGRIKAAQEQTAYMQILENGISVKIDNVISVRLLAF